MSVWAWLVLMWVVLVPAVAVALGTALRRADDRDWSRRGRPDRRERSRNP
jgi:hypothetical protein